MLKKYVSLLLALVLSLGMMTSALAAFDFSYVEQYPEIFDVTKRDDVAFIDAMIAQNAVREHSFTTPYESDDYYSYVYNDIVVVDYDTDEAYSVWRLWVEYVGTRSLHVQSIDLTFNGRTFTFSDVYDESNMDTKDNGDFAETYMIKFGQNSYDFLLAMEEYLAVLSEGDSAAQSIRENGQLIMTLHPEDGSELAIQLPNMILMDFRMVEAAFLNCDGNLGYASNPTPVTEK